MYQLPLIKAMIKSRMTIVNKSTDYFTQQEVDLLPDLAVWSEPEAMILNIMTEYVRYRESGLSEIDAVKKIQKGDAELFNLDVSSYPKEFNAYLSYRLKSEYPTVAYIYSDSVIAEVLNVILNWC